MREQYPVMVLNISHLKDYDKLRLTNRSSDPDNGMVFYKDTGFLVKLYGDLDLDQSEEFSLNFNLIIATALEEGFGMLEFDSDGPLYEDFRTYTE